MDLNKYGETNIVGKDFTSLPQHEYKKLSMYTGFLGEGLQKDAKVLEIGSGNGSFLYFLESYYKLDPKNLSTVDISKSVVDSLNTNAITKRYNNSLSDNIEYLSRQTEKYDLIVIRHVLEHMEKPYLAKLIPLLMESLNKGGKILIEVPNVINFPL